MKQITLTLFILLFIGCKPSIYEILEQQAEAKYNAMLIELESIPEDSLVEIFIDTIYFDKISYSIKPSEYNKLHTIYRLSNRFPQYQIELTGHQIKDTSVHLSMSLSKRRVEKVCEFYKENYRMLKDKFYTHYNDSSNICRCVEVYFTNHPKIVEFAPLKD